MEISKLTMEIKKIIAKVAKVPVSKITAETTVRGDLGLDSIDALDILAIIEKKFEIEIDAAKAYEIIIIRDLVNLVKSYL